MAGWDYPFYVDRRDIDLARGCFRVLRRTAARHYVEFSYYQDQVDSGRVEFILVFDCRPFMLNLAMGDFALEMRAISLIQQGERRKRLPLRLLREVLWTSSEQPLIEQVDPDLVAPAQAEDVCGYIKEYALGYASYLRGESSPSDFLEAQHSLILRLGIALASDATADMGFPAIVESMRLPMRLQQEAKQLGTQRNRVKHRGYQHEAARYVEEHEHLPQHVISVMTGCFATALPSVVLQFERDSDSVLRQPPMFTRYGERRVYTRY